MEKGWGWFKEGLVEPGFVAIDSALEKALDQIPHNEDLNQNFRSFRFFSWKRIFFFVFRKI